MKRLPGKVAVVSGAGAGIGRETALLFASEGARVACIDVHEATVIETAAMVQASGGTALPIQADVSDWVAIESARKVVLREWGGVQILINNAGGDVVGGVGSLGIAEWHRGLSKNLDGAFFLSKVFWPELLADGAASIINNSSIMGLAGDRESVAYCTAKAALVGLTKALAADGARHGLRVNCVCPGFVDTGPMRAYWGAPAADNHVRAALDRKIPLGHVANPAEIARVFLFLACDDSSYMTGATLVVDGGATLGYQGSDVGQNIER